MKNSSANKNDGRADGPDQRNLQSKSVFRPADPREAMRVLPGWLQPMLTELTGKALPSEEPWFRWSRGGRLAATLLEFATGIGGSVAFAMAGGPCLVLLPVTWLMTVSAARTLQTGAGVHHAAHNNLLPPAQPDQPARLNNLAGEVASLLAWIQPLSGYREDHGPHHWKTGTEDDPDIRFLVEVGGLRPGQPVACYWRQFWRTLFSPMFHARFLKARLRANLVTAPWSRRLAAWVWLVLLLGIPLYGGWFLAALAGYFLPVMLFQQMAAWAGLLGLHQWVRIGEGTLSKKQVLAGLTSGRFIGEAAPSPGLRGWAKAWAWTRWTVRMLTVHLAARMAVVQGDLPSHDWHHFKPESPDWPNHAYARRDDLLGGGPNAPLYTELWGVGAAINATFERLSALPENAVLGKPLTYDEQRRVLLGM